MYPGNDVGYNGPVVSLRLKAVRDAMDDYEYFRILTSLGDQASAANIAASVGSNFWQFTSDPADIQEARERLGDRMHQLSP